MWPDRSCDLLKCHQMDLVMWSMWSSVFLSLPALTIYGMFMFCCFQSQSKTPSSAVKKQPSINSGSSASTPNSTNFHRRNTIQVQWYYDTAINSSLLNQDTSAISIILSLSLYCIGSFCITMGSWGVGMKLIGAIKFRTCGWHKPSDWGFQNLFFAAWFLKLLPHFHMQELPISLVQ